MKKILIAFSLLSVAIVAMAAPLVTVQYRPDGVTYQYDTSATDNTVCCNVVVTPLVSQSLLRYASNVGWQDGTNCPPSAIDSIGRGFEVSCAVQLSNAGSIDAFYTVVPSYYYMCSCQPVLQPTGIYDVKFTAKMKNGTTRDTVLTIDTSTPPTLFSSFLTPCIKPNGKPCKGRNSNR